MDVAATAAKNASKTGKTGVSGSGFSLQTSAEAAPGDFAKQLLNALKLTKPWNVGKSEASAASSQAGHAPRLAANRAETRPTRNDDPAPRAQAPRVDRTEERDRIAEARADMIRDNSAARDAQESRPVRDAKSTDKPAESRDAAPKQDKIAEADEAGATEAQAKESAEGEASAETQANTGTGSEGDADTSVEQAALEAEMADPGLQILMQVFVQKIQVKTAATEAFGLGDAQTQDNGADLLGGDALLAGEGEQAQTGAGAAKTNLGQFAARLMGGLGHLQTTKGDEAEGVQNLQTGDDAFLQALARKVEGFGVEAKAVESFASARAAATAVAALDGTQGTAKAEAVQTANAVQNATPVGATGVSHGHQSAATSASGEVRSTANLPPAEQVAVQIQRAMQTGKSRITVELDPAELGKVEVRLDIDRRGQVMASVVAERPDTLDMLQKDARSLEKALASAGLSADMANLNFSLREGPKEQGHQQASKSGRGSGRDANNEDDAAKAAIGEVATAFDRGRRVSLDRALDVIV